MDSDSPLSLMGLAALPPELIIRIIDFALPAAHFNLALSCRYMFECSKDALQAHRKAHSQNAVCSDVLPTTMPDLVRKLLADPACIDMWHLRTLELYWERDCWAKWEICPFTIEKGTRVRGRGFPLGYALTQDERLLFLDVLRERLYFSEKDITAAREDLEGGSDAPFKALVIALCPRLTNVRYSRDYQVSGREAFDDHYGQGPRTASRSSIDYIQRMINLHPDNELWPPGLSSIRFLGVGMRTGAELDQLHSPSPFHLLLDLIKLPILTSLYFHALSQSASSEIYDPDNEPYDVAENSSSIEHIFIDNSALGNPREFRDALETAPKSLKSLTLSASEANDMDRWLSCASETLMLYNTQDLRGYRCTLYRPEEFGDVDLKKAVIDSQDMFLDEYDHRDLGGPYSPSKWASPFQYFVERHDTSYIPSNIETLILSKPSSSGLSEAEADLIDDAILAILANRSVYYRHCPKCDPKWHNYFPNLKAIYLGALEDEYVWGPDGRMTKEPRRRRWFPNSIRAGRLAGVDIHTRTTRGRPLHRVEFPSPPDQAELKFLPDDVREELEGPREFDVYSGRWGPPGCGNCGQCAGCLRRYDPMVWKELDEALMK